jgi:D-proline reductase (dithiol) PrdB
MKVNEETVNGFRFLPPGLAAWIRSYIPDTEFSGPIPWTPMVKALSRAKLALVTSAGISLKTDPPFDMEREKREPTWGDHSFRKIPDGTTAQDINANHLHINTAYLLKDINVMLPIERLAEFKKEGLIGEMAPTAYSYYGFQWQSTEFIQTAIAPMAECMQNEGVDAVLLTPA